MRKNVQLVGSLFILILLSPAFHPLFYHVATGADDPMAPRDYRELMESLNAVTPLEDQVDEDGDRIWDVVETVMGTDFNATDSDYDRLDDLWEIMNGSDPLNPDTNLDGFPDFFEVTNVTLDMRARNDISKYRVHVSSCNYIYI